MKYTDKEIELYGILAELFELNKKEIKAFYGFLLRDKKKTERLGEILKTQMKMNDILKGLKIPNRFLILRKLDEKK